MRPPSYYASIVKSNSSLHHQPASYGTSSDYPSASTPSQQLRSSLSSSSSSSYASRSHLPFVPQSTLVAHCFTGVGSSTRPYGSAATSIGSSSSSFLTPTASLSRNSSTRTSGSSFAPSSRPSSTKRSTYTSSSTISSGYSSSSSSSYLTSSSSRYRPTTSSSSSYYKPIRLRERPLLTQISRQINSSSSYRPASRVSTRRESSTTRTSHSGSAAEEKSSPTTTNEDQSPRDPDGNWSSDVTRNISRNKYLIKFREIDKSSSSSAGNRRLTSADVEVEATIHLPLERERSSGRDSCVPDREPTCEPPAELVATHNMKLPQPEVVVVVASSEEGPLVCDKEKAEPTAAKKKEHKNVKLKLKPIGLGAKKKTKSEPDAEATTTIIQKPADTKADKEAKEPKKQTKEKLAKEPPLPKVEPEAPAKRVAPPEVPSVPKEEPKPTPKPASKQPAEEPPKTVAQTTRDSPPESAPKPVKVLKKVVKTSEKKAKELISGSTKTNSNKENEPEARPKTKVTPPPVEPVAEAPKPAEAVKTRRGSKVPAEDEPVDGQKTTKTKVVKKKKKVQDEGDKSSNGAPKPTRASKKENAGQTPSVDQQPTAASGKRRASREVEAQPAPAPSTRRASLTKQAPGRIRFREYNINDFNFLTVLGHGGWGFVILAELKEHDACFAVKCIKKITIVEDDDYDSIMIERKVLTLGNIHPFICKLFCTFETPGYLFFVMEYCAGGDLMFHVQHEGKFTEPRCRFYAAEIICAIKFLHNRHIIYRDLKLDNILLDARGHIRLVDFGMCQCRTYREEMLPSNFCGTPEYISPEIIKGVPYNHSVDWWSFGVLLYEMAVGKMPFRGNDENELLWNVCYEQIHYPMFLTKELTSLLKSLLEREPTKRMGMATCKAGDIYDQPFFSSVNWKAVEELRVEPPFVPEVRSNRDVSNFDSDFTESTCELSPVDEGTLARIDQKQFEKFPYTNPDIFIFDPTQQQQQQQAAGLRTATSVR